MVIKLFLKEKQQRLVDELSPYGSSLKVKMCKCMSSLFCRFSMEIIILLMVVQPFSGEIGFHMSKNTRLETLLVWSSVFCMFMTFLAQKFNE